MQICVITAGALVADAVMTTKYSVIIIYNFINYKIYYFKVDNLVIFNI